MQDKTAVELGSVQLTLLLPLWGRAIETKKPKPLLVDKAAADIIEKIDYDFSIMAKSVQDVTQFEWIARSIHIDRAINAFLQKHPRATIVNVGCGLDTTFDRVDNGTLRWYDLDLPDVIALRRNFFEENERRKFISGSFTDESWISQIRPDDNILFMAAGVLYYLREDDLKAVFGKLAEAFPGGEFIFDAASPVGVKAANEKLIRKIGLDESSFLKWSLQNSSDISKWEINFSSIKEYPMYKDLKKSLSLRNKIISSVADHYKMMYMVHLKF